MATFVIVHGGFGGGWEWTEVAGMLRRRGHQVFTPTLTGMGERFHLGPEIGLSVHVQDIPRRRHVIDRIRPQPVRTFTEPVRLTGAADRLPRAFVRCTAGGLDIGGDPIEPMAERARAGGWAYRELNAPHDPHLFDPEGTAGVLHELGTSVGR